jgi:hypothetical protein
VILIKVFRENAVAGIRPDFSAMLRRPGRQILGAAARHQQATLSVSGAFSD